MKKFFLFAALAVVGFMTSCSNDDDIASSDTGIINGDVITFSTAKGGSSVLTRSAVTATSIGKFTATAINKDNSVFFDEEDFALSSSYFRSNTSHYWPTTGSLSFYAISDKGTKTVDSLNVPHYTYEDWAGETDLLGSTSIAGQKLIPYPLTFKHLTSQIKISAEAKDTTEELTYKLVSVKLTSPSTGTYSFGTETASTGSWAIDNSKKTTYSYDDVLPLSFSRKGSVNPTSCYWNILPTSNGQLYFRIEYQVIQNGKVIGDFTGKKYKECTVNDPKLSSGKIYTYNFLLTRGTNDVITFSAQVSDWDEEKATSHVVNDQPTLTEKANTILNYLGYSGMTLEEIDDECAANDVPMAVTYNNSHYDDIADVFDSNNLEGSLVNAWQTYLQYLDWYAQGEVSPYSPSDYKNIYDGLKLAIQDVANLVYETYNGGAGYTKEEAYAVFTDIIANAPDQQQ